MKALVVQADWKPKKEYYLTKDEELTRRARIGSQVWCNPHFEYKDVPTPDLEDTEVLIRVRSCGLCGSDTHLYETDQEGYILFSGQVKLPGIIGHEFSGIVEKTGRRVVHLKIGDAVTAESILWCGLCSPCRRGALNQCQSLDLLGLSSNGALAEFIVIDEKYCWKINKLRDVADEDTVFDIGALIEPIGCAYNGLFVSGGGFRPGDTLVVYGTGPIGLAAIALGKISGASKIIAFDKIDSRLKLAQLLGADYVYNLDQMGNQNLRPQNKVLELTNGEGANIQVEAAGAASFTIPAMLESMAPNSKIIYLGRSSDLVSIELNRLVSCAASIHGARGHAGNDIFPNIIKLIALDKLKIKDMITASYPFSNTIEAIKTSTKRDNGKIIIKI